MRGGGISTHVIRGQNEKGEEKKKRRLRKKKEERQNKTEVRQKFKRKMKLKGKVNKKRAKKDKKPAQGVNLGALEKEEKIAHSERGQIWFSDRYIDIDLNDIWKPSYQGFM